MVSGQKIDTGLWDAYLIKYDASGRNIGFASSERFVKTGHMDSRRVPLLLLLDSRRKYSGTCSFDRHWRLIRSDADGGVQARFRWRWRQRISYAVAADVTGAYADWQQDRNCSGSDSGTVNSAFVLKARYRRRRLCRLQSQQPGSTATDGTCLSAGQASIDRHRQHGTLRRSHLRLQFRRRSVSGWCSGFSADHLGRIYVELARRQL